MGKSRLLTLGFFALLLGPGCLDTLPADPPASIAELRAEFTVGWIDSDGSDWRLHPVTDGDAIPIIRGFQGSEMVSVGFAAPSLAGRSVALNCHVISSKWSTQTEILEGWPLRPSGIAPAFAIVTWDDAWSGLPTELNCTVRDTEFPELTAEASAQVTVLSWDDWRATR